VVKVIPRCGICEPDADPAPLMDGLLEATCAHCGAIVTRHRQWKPDGPGILRGEDVFICTPPGDQPPTAVRA
jgi:hypothetical protein